MKIAIHGTNKGYDTITPESVAGLFDARPDFSKVAARGQQAYSIHFSEDNVIFSKYRIIRDALGDSRIGNVAFSLVVPNNKKLKGADVKSLLDRVDKEFSGRYIENNNLGAIRNDWAFIDDIRKEYEPKLGNNPTVEHPPKGDGEAAFVYYSTDKALEKYFELPYQSAYGSYRQVFFVDKGLKDKDENPLNALRYSESDDLTEKVPPPEPPPPPPRRQEFVGFVSNGNGAGNGGDRVFAGKGGEEAGIGMRDGNKPKKSILKPLLIIVAVGVIIAEAGLCVKLYLSDKSNKDEVERLKERMKRVNDTTAKINGLNDSLKDVIAGKDNEINRLNEDSIVVKNNKINELKKVIDSLSSKPKIPPKK